MSCDDSVGPVTLEIIFILLQYTVKNVWKIDIEFWKVLTQSLRSFYAICNYRIFLYRLLMCIRKQEYLLYS